MKKHLFSFLVLGLFLSGAFLNAQSYYSCDRWGLTTSSSYTIYNNIWGDNYGSQCLSVNSFDDWWVDANHSGSGIKSYPNVEQQMSVNVGDMGSITSSFSVSHPNSGDYTCAYDIWYDNYAYEIMLWMNYYGEIGPISYNYGCSGYPSWACPEATNVNVGGHTWNVYRGSNGSNEVFSFIRTSNTNSGTVDITAISQWLRNNGWFGNANLHSVQFGFEITATNGTGRFAVNDFDVSVGSDNGDDGDDGADGSVYQFKNRSTGLFIDGMGRTNNGDATGQYANTTHPNAQWSVVDAGSGYSYLVNVGTGMKLDGYGRTSNGSVCAQYNSSTTHYNAQWQFIDAGSGYYFIQNRGTGMRIDGYGFGSNGSDLMQYSNTTHYNAQWQMISVKSASDAIGIVNKEEGLTIYPNPVANSDFVISTLINEAADVNVFIYNSLGQVVYSESFGYQEKGEFNHIVSREALSSGIYVVSLNIGNEVINEKLLIEK